MATPVQDRQQVDSSISYDFNYVETPPDRLVCKICRLPCREAQKSECCDHVFCKRDIDKMKTATAVSHACPICRVEPFKTYPDRAVDREIKGLKIYCRNKEVGCGCSWSGELDQIDVHLNKCEITCKYCKEVRHYTAMISHINECPCYCQYCNTVVEKDGQHMEKCSKFLIPCPNTCGKDKIPLDEIDSHKDECRLEMVWCEYYDVGCKTTLVREEMPAHYRDAMGEHLQYMHSVVRQLQKEKEKLDNAKVVAEVNSLENAEQIKELLSNQTLHEEARTKIRKDISILSGKYKKIESNVSRSGVLVGVLVLVFAVLVTRYENKFTLITEQLRNLSEYDDANQLHNDGLLNLFQENAKLQNDQIAKAVIEASANIELVKHYLISILCHFISSLAPYIAHNLDILTELSGNVPLVSPIFKLTDYKKMIEGNKDWVSSPFMVYDEGYHLCLKIYPAGIGKGADSHVSVELYVMEAEKLQHSGHWPLKGYFSVQLLKVNNEMYHYDEMKFVGLDSHVLTSLTSGTIKFKEINLKVNHTGMIKIGSNEQLVSHTELTRLSQRNSYFGDAIADGNLYFRVIYYSEGQAKYRDIYTLSKQLNVHKLSLQHALTPLHLSFANEDMSNQMIPVILQLSRMVIGDTWYSSPFFAFVGGYQVRLKVVRVRNCLLSSEIFLMKGPHDEKLQKLGLWPLKGTFTVKLFGNDTYYPCVYTLSDEERCTKCYEQVTTNDMASESFGFSLFTLDGSCTKSNFFKDNALFLEVMYNKLTAVYV